MRRIGNSEILLRYGVADCAAEVEAFDVRHALLSVDWRFHLSAGDKGVAYTAGIYDGLLCRTEMLANSVHLNVAVIVLNFVFEGGALFLNIGVCPRCDFLRLTVLLEMMVLGLVMISIGCEGKVAAVVFEIFGLFAGLDLEDVFEAGFGRFVE